MKGFSGCTFLLLLLVAGSCKPEGYTLRLPDQGVVSPDTTQARYRIGAFSLTDQQGKPVTREDMRGKVVIFNFFFTFCPTICPTTMANLKQVQADLADRPEVLILSATLAPWYDQPDTLLAYAANMGIRYPQWRLLTGNKDLIYRLSAESCHIGGMETPTAPGGIDHSPYAAIFDDQGWLRGLYTVTDPEEVEKLIDHAEKLLP